MKVGENMKGEEEFFLYLTPASAHSHMTLMERSEEEGRAGAGQSTVFIPIHTALAFPKSSRWK